MSANQSATGLGIGTKIGIAAAVLVVGGVLFLRRGSEPAAIEGTTPPAPMEQPQQRAGRVLGQSANANTSSSIEDAESRAMAVRSKLEAQAKARQEKKAAIHDTKNQPVGQVDIERNPDDIPALKRVVLEDSDPERRLAAVTLLGISDNPEAIGVLAQALSDEDENVRMEAVLALADFTDEAPVEVLAHAMNDPSAEIRYEALDALSDIETPESRHVVQNALNDPDPEVRELAEIILDLSDDEE